jgi:hypothetical protein
MLAAGCAFRAGPKVTRRQGWPSHFHAGREVPGSHQGQAEPAPAQAASAAVRPFRSPPGAVARSARPGCCRPFIRSGAGHRSHQGQPAQPARPPTGRSQRIEGVSLGALSVIFCHLGVQLAAFAAHAALQAPHFRRGIGLHRPPLAVPAAGGLPGPLAGRLLIGSGICLGLLDPRPRVACRAARPGADGRAYR